MKVDISGVMAYKIGTKVNSNLNSLSLLSNVVDVCVTSVENKKYLKYSIIKREAGVHKLEETTGGVL